MDSTRKLARNISSVELEDSLRSGNQHHIELAYHKLGGSYGAHVEDAVRRTAMQMKLIDHNFDEARMAADALKLMRRTAGDKLSQRVPLPKQGEYLGSYQQGGLIPPPGTQPSPPPVPDPGGQYPDPWSSWGEFARDMANRGLSQSLEGRATVAGMDATQRAIQSARSAVANSMLTANKMPPILAPPGISPNAVLSPSTAGSREKWRQIGDLESEAEWGPKVQVLVNDMGQYQQGGIIGQVEQDPSRYAQQVPGYQGLQRAGQVIGGMAKDVYDISAPNIFNQIYRKMTGQPNTLGQIPRKVVQTMTPIMAGAPPEAGEEAPSVTVRRSPTTGTTQAEISVKAEPPSIRYQPVKQAGGEWLVIDREIGYPVGRFSSQAEAEEYAQGRHEADARFKRLAETGQRSYGNVRDYYEGLPLTPEFQEYLANRGGMLPEWQDIPRDLRSWEFPYEGYERMPRDHKGLLGPQRRPLPWQREAMEAAQGYYPGADGNPRSNGGAR